MVGGGPAGSAAAIKLARLGYAVAVFEHARFPRPHVGESLVPGVLALLDQLGVRERVESAGFLRPSGVWLKWNGPVEWRASSGRAAGFQVDRGRLDQLLLEAAARAGADVRQPCRAPMPYRVAPFDWRIGDLAARFLVDAAGRRRLLSRRTVDRGRGTIALYSYWSGLRECGADTRVELGEGCWYWGAPLPDGTFNATVFVDPQLLRGRDIGSFYEEKLAESELLSACLEGWRGGVNAIDATACTASEVVGADWVSAGESACCIDPLSSQGVLTALRMGIHAAALANTVLLNPADGDLAAGFYNGRVATTAERHRRFQADTPLVGGEVLPGLDDTIRLTPEARVGNVAVLVGDRIVARTGLTHPLLDSPVAFVGGVDVGPLLAHLVKPITVRRLLETWTDHIPASAAVQFLGELIKCRALDCAEPPL